ncbi:gamma-glutamyltransferase [Thalassobaculum sp.]|uniref:gamma-glutamyltransferase n=1 Tax=Thalassobaculum sp. TaxID=2022740 RepID=UPI0032F0262B
MRDLHRPGRSPVYAPNAAIATSHPLATQAGIDVLKSGGTAVDAAVAACAVLCVVEPAMTGIGGDCFALIAPKGSGDIVALNGSGRAPAAAELGWYLERGIKEIGMTADPHAVTVPGAIAAWTVLLERFGKKGFAELLAPAIRFAEEGFPVASRVGADWIDDTPRLQQHAVSREFMLVNGKAPAIGTRHSNPRLGATFRRIAEKGRDGFYTGPVADDIVKELRSLGGLHTLEDFAKAEAEWVDPIKTTFRGHDVYECPPNGQGICALMIMNILSGYDIAGLSDVQRIHLLAEATKLAYAQRDRYVSDPRQVDVPVDWLLSEEHAKGLRAMIDPQRAGAFRPSDFPVHKDTIYLSCVDADGTAISFINSLFSGFGSAIMAPESGVMLQNRGRSFCLQEGHANAIAPNKRPMHTIIPGMVVKDGKAVAPFGVMGGQYQSTGHTGFLSNILDLGMDVQESMDAPRSFALGGKLQVENTFAPEIYAALEAKGHILEHMGKPLGGSQAVWIDRANGCLVAGSDPRKDGCALGY